MGLGFRVRSYGSGVRVTSTASSRVWVPARTRSGSTMGTRPSLWQMSA